MVEDRRELPFLSQIFTNSNAGRRKLTLRLLRAIPRTPGIDAPVQIGSNLLHNPVNQIEISMGGWTLYHMPDVHANLEICLKKRSVRTQDSGLRIES